MQERTFYKAGLIGVGPQMDVEPECDAGHPHTVFIGRDAAVLDKFLHLQRVRVIGNPFQKNVHTDFFFRGQFADHSNSSTRAAVSSRSAVPSTTRIGQHSAFCHVSCRAALRVSRPPLSYPAAHCKKDKWCSCMSPPGSMRLPNRAYSRCFMRANRVGVSVTTRTASVNFGISASPQPTSEPDTTAPFSALAMSCCMSGTRCSMGRFFVNFGSVGSQK